MRILFVTTAHNSLRQWLQVELTDRGHGVAIHLATRDEAMTNAVKEHRPDLIVAPMLKRAIAREIWDHHTCLIVHPGIKGDRPRKTLMVGRRNHGLARRCRPSCSARASGLSAAWL